MVLVAMQVALVSPNGGVAPMTPYGDVPNGGVAPMTPFAALWESAPLVKMDSALSYIGLSGGSIAIISGVVYLLRKVITSQCIRGPDGTPHLDIAFHLTQQDVQQIEASPELKSMLDELKKRLSEAKRPASPSQVVVA